jgi:hypothetical protein
MPTRLIFRTDGMTLTIGANEVDLKRAAFQIGHDVAFAGG